MPIYGYECCGQSVDKLQKISDPAPACPVCAKPMQKQLTAPGGFDLKGGGYYKNGFSK